MIPWARDRVEAEGSESLGVPESAMSVTGAFTAPRVIWAEAISTAPTSPDR